MRMYLLRKPVFCLQMLYDINCPAKKKISVTVSRYVSSPLLSRGKENLKKEVENIKLFVGETGPPNLSIARY